MRRWITASIVGVTIFTLAILGLSLFVFPSPLSPLEAEEARVVSQLNRVLTADAESSAQDDADAGKHQFYAVCGFSCDTPRIDIETARRCYPAVEVKVIEGTGDAILGDEHLRLQSIAQRFAEQYNTAMAGHLRANGFSNC